MAFSLPLTSSMLEFPSRDSRSTSRETNNCKINNKNNNYTLNNMNFYIIEIINNTLLVVKYFRMLCTQQLLNFYEMEINFNELF